MSARNQDLVTALGRRLRTLARAIDLHTVALETLYPERLTLWRDGVELGMTHREIAAESGVRTVTVSGALAPGKKRGRT